MVAHPEHALQTKINQWVREAVCEPHFFCGIDRSKATSAFTHTREKARGLVSGTPDTLLLIPGLPCVLVELKAPGGEGPTKRQNDVGSAIALAGHSWNWCDSVRGYMEIVAAAGVPLLDRAADLADKHDAVLAAAAARRAMAPRKRPAARKPGLRFEWGRAATKRAAKAGVLV